MGRAGGTGPTHPGLRARCRPVRRRGPGADRPRPGGGGRARPPSSGRQAGMIKVNLAPPTTKRPRRAAAAGPELNLGILFGGILAVLVLIIGGWWLAMSLEDRRLTAEIEKNRLELEHIKFTIKAVQCYRRASAWLAHPLRATATVPSNQVLA